MQVIYQWPTWILAVGLIAMMFIANELGYRIGLKRPTGDSERSQAVSNGMKSSVIGLVALLLGFSFAMTTNRFRQRREIVLEEANAIGTCYLRASLLALPARGQIQDVLRRYSGVRLEHFREALNPMVFERTTQMMNDAMVELWAAVETAVADDHDLARVSQIVPTANHVIDLCATRAWASHNQTPPSVILLLAVCAVVSSGLMGNSSGQVATRHLGLWTALNVLVVLVVFVVLDFDRPRRGQIRVDHAR